MAEQLALFDVPAEPKKDTIDEEEKVPFDPFGVTKEE